MFDYKIIAYNKLGKVQETENVFCPPDEVYDVLYTMSEQFGYAEALDTMDTHCGEYGEDLFHLVKEDISKCFNVLTFTHGQAKNPL